MRPLIPLTALIVAVLLAGCGDGDPYPPGTSSATYGTSGGTGGTSGGSGNGYAQNPTLKASSMSGLWQGTMTVTAGAATVPAATAALMPNMASLFGTSASEAITAGTYNITFTLKQLGAGDITGDFSDNMMTDSLKGTANCTGTGGTTVETKVQVTGPASKAEFVGSVTTAEKWTGTVALTDIAGTAIGSGTFTVTRKFDSIMTSSGYAPLEIREVDMAFDDYDITVTTPEGDVVTWLNSFGPTWNYIFCDESSNKPDTILFSKATAGIYKIGIRLYHNSSAKDWNKTVRIEIYQYGQKVSTPFQKTITQTSNLSSAGAGLGLIVGDVNVTFVP